MITNKDLKLCSKQVFTYSAQYQAPFYGREKSIAEMREKTASLKNGEILYISQPLGTGKTFLVNHMINIGAIPVQKQTEFLVTRTIADDPAVMKSFPSDILIVDETDIKTSHKKLIKGIDSLRGYLDDTGKKAIVLGDYTMRSKELNDSLGASRMLLSFEPMDRSFLEGVLVSRFESFMSDFISADFSLDSVIDPKVIDFLAPEWMKSVNSFRSIFSLMQSVVDNNKYVRYNSDKAYIELSMFKEYLATEGSFGAETDEQEEFFNLLVEYIKSEHPNGSGIGDGFTTDMLYELAKNAEIDVDYEDFSEGVLEYLIADGWLVSTGKPYLKDGKYIRRPEPYVPSLKLLLSII